MGEEVNKAALSFLEREMEKPTNFTHISLIPKVKAPMNVSNYRPISLCNIMYKIIAKTLANKMKNVLEEVISSNWIT